MTDIELAKKLETSAREWRGCEVFGLLALASQRINALIKSIEHCHSIHGIDCACSYNGDRMPKDENVT